VILQKLVRIASGLQFAALELKFGNSRTRADIHRKGIDLANLCTAAFAQAHGALAELRDLLCH
jgi:hypothetical protein